MKKIWKPNFVWLSLFIIFLLTNLFYLLNKNFVFFPEFNTGYTTISSYLGFSVANNLIFITMNIYLTFSVIFFLNKNILFIKKKITLNNFLKLFIPILFIFIFIINLPYSNPIKIGNFSDIVHDSEKLAFFTYSYFSNDLIQNLKDTYTLHGWFADYYISYAAFKIFGFENIIFGLRSLNSFFHLFVTSIYLVFIFFFVKKFFNNNNFSFYLITFYASFLLFGHLGILGVIDRMLFVYLVLTLYLNFNFDNIKLKKNYHLSILISFFVFLCFFYNFYQFVTIFIINIITLILISLLYKNIQLFFTYLISTIFFFIISLFFINYEIYHIGLEKINELISTGKNGTLYDFRYGYTLANSVLSLYFYFFILGFILFHYIKNFINTYSLKNKIFSLKLFFKNNIYTFILLFFSLVGFYQFIIRGTGGTYIQSSNFIHFLIIGYIIFKLIGNDKIKLLSVYVTFITLIIIFSDINIKKKNFIQFSIFF